MKRNNRVLESIRALVPSKYLFGFSVIFALSSLQLIWAGGTTFLPKGDVSSSAFNRDFVVDNTASVVTIDVESMEETVTEGCLVIFQISRNTSVGDLWVNLLIGGNATFNSDYIIRGADVIKSIQAMVIIPDSRNFVEVVVEVMDDVSAEGKETITLTLDAGTGYMVDTVLDSAMVTIAQNDFTVTTTADAGEGSLRQAILNANAFQGPNTITFDTKVGPFAMPQTITLESDLPDLTGRLTIDGYIEGRLWLPTGVRLSGGNQHRVFNVISGARVAMRSLTIENGYARDGGGIANHCELVVNGVTFKGNVADRNGGGLANLGGTVTVINSTFANNTADNAGGGLADDIGKVTITNCTFSGNTAKTGGGLFSNGTLLLRNTILANSIGNADCVVNGDLDPISTNNLIEVNEGCGEPICTADPRLGALGGYNGPTPTFPLGGGSPAINLGHNASAVDENGKPLRWDQRGNGDPRFVGGITDIGAFEHQAFPLLIVDTFEDTDLRACTHGGAADCSLRGAIILANATIQPDIIRFDPKVFQIPRTIALEHPLPDLTTNMTIDGSGAAGITVNGNSRITVFNVVPDAEVRLIDIRIDNDRSLKQRHRPCGGCLFPLP